MRRPVTPYAAHNPQIMRSLTTPMRTRTTPVTALTTDDFVAKERAPVWCEWIWKHFGGLQSDLYGDTEFDGHIASSKAGEVILTRLEANRHRVVRTMDMVRSSEEGYLKIVAPVKGQAYLEQGNSQTWVNPGTWTIYDTTGSYAIANPGRVEHLIVMVPKACLVGQGLNLQRLMARPVGGNSGIARVALSTMRSTFEELPYMSPDTARGAGTLITDLVRLSLMELSGQQTQLTQREALKDRIRAYVALHLRDPNLSIDKIANAMNCSRRHLYNAFADEQLTLANYIQDLRLTACARELQQQGAYERAITDISMHWGFNNSSHFSRVFKAHAGMSASEFRRNARA